MSRIYFRKCARVGLCVNFTTDDKEMMIRSQNDFAITQYLVRRFPLYPQEETEWLEKLHKHVETDQVFGIVLLETEELIGMMGLHRIDWVSRRASTGAWIAADANRGKGLGSEAKMLLLDYAFNTLMLRKVCSYVLATNLRSKRYNEKCGYTVEGILKRHVAVYGDYVDELAMAVFKEDFDQVWRGYQASFRT